MRKFLTCTMAVALMFVSAPASSAKIITEAGVPSRATRLENRLEHATHLIDQLNENNRRLHRYIKRMRQRVIAASTPPTPTPTTSSAATSSGGIVSDTEAATLLRNAGFPESAISTMIGYMHRESGGDPTATNSSSGACGLWQMYPCPGPQALDPQTNANMAYAKYAASGFSPWGG